MTTPMMKINLTLLTVLLLAPLAGTDGYASRNPSMKHLTFAFLIVASVAFT